MKKTITVLFAFVLLQINYVDAKYKVVSIYPEQAFYLNGGTKAKFGGGLSRKVLTIELPKNTVGWYYTITTSESKGQTASIQLASQLTRLVDPSGLTALAVSAIATPQGTAYADVYFFTDLGSVNGFMDKNNYKFQYVDADSRTHYLSGTVEIKDHLSGTFYIGLRNPAMESGLNISIEVAAIVKEESESQNEGQLYCNLGCKEYQNGEYEKCVEYCKKALNNDSNLCVAQCHIGLCYLIKGNDEAIDAYVKAIAMMKKTHNPKQNITEALQEINEAIKKNGTLKNSDMVKELLEEESKKY